MTEGAPERRDSKAVRLALTHGSDGERAGGPREARAVWLAFAVLVAAIYLYFPNKRAIFFTPNELSRIYLAQAIVEEGSFRIDSAVERHGETVDMARFEGHYYSDKAPGVAFLGVPVYFLFRALSGGAFTERDLIPVCRSFVVTLPALFFLAAAFRRSAGHGALGPLLIVGLAVGTSFFPFAISYYGHTLLAILLFWIFWRVTEKVDAGPAHYALTGLLCGTAVLVDYTGAVFAAFAALYLLWKKRSVVPLLWLAVGSAPALALLLTYNYQCFGSPFDLAYNHMVRERDQVHRTTGFFGIGSVVPEAIWGLTFGLGRGLFIYSPFLLLVVPAVATLGRPWRWEARDVLAASTIAAYFWLNASLIDWQGGWTLGPRYLVPIYPFVLFLILRAAAKQSAAARRRALAFALCAVTWSGLFHLAGVASFLHTPDAPFQFPVPEIAAFMFAHGVTQENLGLGLGLPGVWSLFPVVLILAALLALGSREEPRAWPRLGLAAAFGASALVAVFALTYLTMGDEKLEKARMLTATVAMSQATDPP